MDKPLISFVLPTYNRIAWIAECVESLRKQTLENIEIIVVDDASTDSTEKVMRWFCEQDKRIKYIKNETNKGAGESRNVGNLMAKADIICVADSDDFYPETRAEETLEYFKNNPDTGIVNGSYYRVDYSNNVQGKFKASDYEVEHYFCHPSSAYRKEFIISMPYHKESKEQTDDYQLVKECVENGKTIKGVDNIWCFHRVLPGSIMTEMRGGSLE